MVDDIVEFDQVIDLYQSSTFDDVIVLSQTSSANYDNTILIAQRGELWELVRSDAPTETPNPLITNTISLESATHNSYDVLSLTGNNYTLTTPFDLVSADYDSNELFLTGNNFTDDRIQLLRSEAPTETPNPLFQMVPLLKSDGLIYRYVAFDSKIVLTKTYSPEFDETIFIQAPEATWDNTIFIQAPDVTWDSQIFLVAGTPELISVTIEFPPFSPARFDEKIDVEMSYHGRYDEKIMLILSTPELISTTLTLMLKGTAFEYDETIFIQAPQVQWDNEITLRCTSTFNETVLLTKTLDVTFDETVLLSLPGSIDYDEDLMLTRTFGYDQTILLEKSRQFDELIFLQYTSSTDFDNVIVLSKTSSPGFDETIFIQAPEVGFDGDILLVISAKFDDVIYVQAPAATFDSVIELEKTITFDDVIVTSRTVLAEFDNVIMINKSVRFDETIFIQAPQKQFDDTILIAKSKTFDETINIGHFRWYGNTILVVKSSSKTFDETIFVQGPRAVYDINIWVVKTKTFDETIFVQAPDATFDSTIVLEQSRQFDEKIIVAISIAFDELIYTENSAQFDETMLVQAPEVGFNDIIELDKSKQFDQTIFTKAPDVSFDNTVLIVKSVIFDERIALWRQVGVVFDEVINLSKAAPVIYDETILIEGVNGPQYLMFDETIFIQSPGVVFDSTIDLSHDKLFDERLALIKTMGYTFDDVIDIAASAKYDNTVLLSQLYTLVMFDEVVTITKTASSSFDDIIYLTRIGNSGGGIGGDPNGGWDQTISLVISWVQFDNTIYINSGGIVSQVDDRVRDSTGKAIGVIASGAEFII